jgi:hypothetical protein
MSGDKLVFDLSQEVEGSPNVFVRKDWINILDNMNQNYNANQSVVDTSQLSNSNKYASYREAYLMMPMLLTLSTTEGVFTPNQAGFGANMAIGLKNWFGTIVHSITVDWAGTTIIQQTPYINMWNSFKLMTSLSWNDVITSGATLGFFPDNPLSFTFNTSATASGSGVCNNTTSPSNLVAQATVGNFSQYLSGQGNDGFAIRQQYINFDPQGIVGTAGTGGAGVQYSSLISANSVTQLWKSYVQTKTDNVVGGMLEIAVSATVYLKHLHSFFAMCPLVKGAFLKITLNLNNTTTTFQVSGDGTSPNATTLTLVSVANAVGGTNPLMISSVAVGQGGDGLGAKPTTPWGAATYTASVQVGANALNSAVTSTGGYAVGTLAKSVYLYIPMYSFAPVFEEAYLSAPVKSIKYTDVYQYQVLNIAGGGAGQMNNLLTNGIANLKSVLLLPFFSASAGSANTCIPQGIPVYQSPFDPAGTGPTSPLCLFNNFNVVISGQNAIYNTERYSFEHFNNQLYPANKVNAGMTDGLTSGLFNALGFEMEYCYWYVDVSRMLEVETSVPKSVQIIGTNQSVKAVDLFCFLEYGCEIALDILTGSRV